MGLIVGQVVSDAKTVILLCGGRGREILAPVSIVFLVDAASSAMPPPSIGVVI